MKYDFQAVFKFGRNRHTCCYVIFIWEGNSGLADFAYRSDVSWWIFVLAGVAALIALAIRAVVDNPVDSLRDD